MTGIYPVSHWDESEELNVQTAVAGIVVAVGEEGLFQ